MIRRNLHDDVDDDDDQSATFKGPADAGDIAGN